MTEHQCEPPARMDSPAEVSTHRLWQCQECGANWRVARFEELDGGVQVAWLRCVA